MSCKNSILSFTALSTSEWFIADIKYKKEKITITILPNKKGNLNDFLEKIRTILNLSADWF